MVTVKVYYRGEVARFSWDAPRSGPAFSVLVQKIRQHCGDLDLVQTGLYWKDEEGDMIVMKRAEDVQEALKNVQSGIFRVYAMERDGTQSIPPSSRAESVVLVDDVRQEQQLDVDITNAGPQLEASMTLIPEAEVQQQQEATNEDMEDADATDTDPENPGVHRGVVCDACERPIVGKRFKCIVCEDFDLCEACETANIPPSDKNTTHNENHTMIRINKPSDFKRWMKFLVQGLRGCPGGPPPPPINMRRGFGRFGCGRGGPGASARGPPPPPLGFGPPPHGFPPGAFHIPGMNMFQSQGPEGQAQDFGPHGAHHRFHHGQHGGHHFGGHHAAHHAAAAAGASGGSPPRDRCRRSCGGEGMKRSDTWGPSSGGRHHHGHHKGMKGARRAAWSQWMDDMRKSFESSMTIGTEPQATQQEAASEGTNTNNNNNNGGVTSPEDFLKTIGEQVANVLDAFGIDVDVHTANQCNPTCPASQTTKTTTESDGKTTTTATASATAGNNSTTSTTVTTEPTNLVTTTTVMNTESVTPETNTVVQNVEPMEETVPKTKEATPDKSSTCEWVDLAQADATAPPAENVCAAPNSSVYPSLINEESPNPQVTAALQHLLAMGFTNDGGWLTQLAEAKEGNILAILDVLAPAKKSN